MLDLITGSQEDYLERIDALDRLPVTGMHGDMHLFNFVRDANGAHKLVDWEHFSEHGSFAFDYLNFHLTAERWVNGASLLDAATALNTLHPVVVQTAKTLNVDPLSLTTYYKATRASLVAKCVRQQGAMGGKVRARLISLINSTFA